MGILGFSQDTWAEAGEERVEGATDQEPGAAVETLTIPSGLQLCLICWCPHQRPGAGRPLLCRMGRLLGQRAGGAGWRVALLGAGAGQCDGGEGIPRPLGLVLRQPCHEGLANEKRPGLWAGSEEEGSSWLMWAPPS